MRFPFSRTSLATVRVIHRGTWVLLKALGSSVIQRGMTGAQIKTMELEEEDGKTDSLGIKSVPHPHPVTENVRVKKEKND